MENLNLRNLGDFNQKFADGLRKKDSKLQFISFLSMTTCKNKNSK